jgi:hypothetical protein
MYRSVDSVVAVVVALATVRFLAARLEGGGQQATLDET